MTPADIEVLVEGLDHPEGVCLGSDGMLYAGGEAGQLYRFTSAGEDLREVGSTGGFLLGLAADGDGGIQVCDSKRRALLRIAADGAVTVRAKGFTLPNFPVFAANGDLFVSDSGDYWHERGTGTIRIIRADGTSETFHRGPFRFANGLALSADQRWLYVVESRSGTILRISAQVPDSEPELVSRLPPERVPDGLSLTDDGRLLVSCYTPDELWLVEPSGALTCLLRDPTHELLVCPANTLLHAGRIYVANIGGWSVAGIATDLRPGRIHRPRGLHQGSA